MLCRRKYTIIKLKVYDKKALFISHHKAETIRSCTESTRSYFYNFKGNFQIMVRVSFKLGLELLQIRINPSKVTFKLGLRWRPIRPTVSSKWLWAWTFGLSVRTIYFIVFYSSSYILPPEMIEYFPPMFVYFQIGS